MRSFLILLPLLVLTACSGGGPARAKFNIELNGFPVGSSFGGLLIYGHSGTNRFNRVIANSVGTATGSITEELPKGVWNFGAIGWLGAEAFSGEIRCAFQTVVLDSDEASVNLALTNARCFDSDVALSATSTFSTPKAFYPVKSSFCEGTVEGRTNNECSYDPEISPTPRGFVGSYKFLAPGGRVINGTTTLYPNEVLESKCYRAGTDAEPVAAPTYTTTGLNIPAFLPGVATPLRIQAFLSDDCSPAKGSMMRSLTSPTEAKIHWFSPGQNLLHVSTPVAALCGISDSMGTLDFAAGVGSASAPYLICNERQLVHLQQNFHLGTIASSSYVLGRDLNLLATIKGPTGTTPADPCLGTGDTFVPIGKRYNETPSPCTLTDLTTSSAFRFDGNGKKVSHFRYKANTFEIGFFSELSGRVYNLTLEQAEVEGRDWSGILAGVGFNPTIKNVRVTNSRLRGEDEIGGVIGKANGTGIIENVHVDGVEIEGWSFTGGVVGQSTTIPIMKASFDGDIYISSNNTKVGGIVGATGAPLNEVVSSGYIHGKSTYMGGIAGQAGVISFARSDVFINDYDSGSTGSRFIGGIAGSASTIDRSYYRGSIRTSCVTAPCEIGLLTGSPVTETFAYAAGSAFAVDGEDGDLGYTIDEMSIGNSLRTDLCTGLSPCGWSQVPGDIPRLSFESNHLCSVPANFASVSAQGLAGRGSSATNPITICRRDAFADITSTGDRHFKLLQNLNLKDVTLSGDLDGHFDGNGKILFGFSRGSGVNYALFEAITAGSTFRNVHLAGFLHQDWSAGVFDKAPLALTNQGTISQVRISDLTLGASDQDFRLGGVVVENHGLISNVDVYGNLGAPGILGGVAVTNTGTIQDSKVGLRMELNYSTIIENVGGIVAVNNGLIQRNVFHGEILNAHGGGPVGGIVGKLEKIGSVVPRVLDNHVDPKAVMTIGGTHSGAGGIVGFSTDPSNIMARNIHSGFIFDESTGTVNALLGTGNATDVVTVTVNGVPTPQTHRNYKQRSEHEFLDSITPGGLATVPDVPAPGLCEMTFLTTSVDNNAVTHGAIKLNSGKYLMGTYTYLSPLTYKLTVPLRTSDCTSLNGSNGGVLAYKAISTPDVVSVSSLKADFYKVADMQDATDFQTVISSYLSILRNETPLSPPVWIWDDEEDDRPSLFNSR